MLKTNIYHMYFSSVLPHIGVMVPVLFSLQIYGADYPFYEFSQMSEKSVFFTKNHGISTNNLTLQNLNNIIPEIFPSSSSTQTKRIRHNNIVNSTTIIDKNDIGVTGNRILPSPIRGVSNLPVTGITNNNITSNLIVHPMDSARSTSTSSTTTFSTSNIHHTHNKHTTSKSSSTDIIKGRKSSISDSNAGLLETIIQANKAKYQRKLLNNTVIKPISIFSSDYKEKKKKLEKHLLLMNQYADGDDDIEADDSMSVLSQELDEKNEKVPDLASNTSNNMNNHLKEAILDSNHGNTAVVGGGPDNKTGERQKQRHGGEGKGKGYGQTSEEITHKITTPAPTTMIRKQEKESTSIITDPMHSPPSITTTTTTTNSINNINPMSKTKKQIIKAIIEGKKYVELEKIGDHMMGVGTSEHFV